MPCSIFRVFAKVQEKVETENLLNSDAFSYLSPHSQTLTIYKFHLFEIFY